MDANRSRWGVEQWAAYVQNQALPVMRRSQLLVQQLAAAEGERLAPRDLADIVLQDPLLALSLLREAERRKSHRLDHETTTALAAIMQLGVDAACRLLLASPCVDESRPGLLAVESRARVSAQIARVWASGRLDLNPDEVALAALLATTGELLLWVYAAEIPLRADDELHSGRAARSAQAQTRACGFTFDALTLQLAELWQLPALLVALLRGSDSLRAQLTRTCTNAARHVLDVSASANAALACDLVAALQLVPGVGVDTLIDALVELPEDRREPLQAAVQRALEAAQEQRGESEAP